MPSDTALAFFFFTYVMFHHITGVLYSPIQLKKIFNISNKILDVGTTLINNTNSVIDNTSISQNAVYSLVIIIFTFLHTMWLIMKYKGVNSFLI